MIRSSAIPDDNPEVIAARAAGIPVLKRAEFLEHILRGKEVIAIAGTHGKTTTTAMAAWVLTRLGKDPSYIIGGVAKNMGRNAHLGAGNAFVIEADEYDNMFLGLSPIGSSSPLSNTTTRIASLPLPIIARLLAALSNGCSPVAICSLARKIPSQSP